MSLVYLFDSNIQFQDKSGNNNVNGFLRVYIDNTDDRAVTYKDFNGTLNQADIRLDNNGRAVVIVDDSKTYRLEVYGTTGVLLWTLYPISPKATGINETLEALVAAVKSHTIAIEGLALGKKNKQQAKVISGTTTQTVKSLSQNADGEITVEFEDIDFPYNIQIDSPDDSIEVGTPVVDPVRKEETIPISVKRPGLVKADSADTEPGTLIDKLEVVDNVRDPEDPQDVPMLSLETTVDGQGNRKVAISEDNLQHALRHLVDGVSSVIDTLDSMDFDEVPHGSFGSSLNQSPGDGTSTSIQVSIFRPIEATVGDAISWTKTTEIGGEDFGTVTLEPGTYIICSDITCQWVGVPAGTYLPQVGNVLGEPFDFSQPQEVHRRMTNVVTVSATTQFKMRISFDAATPVMGFWINSAQIVKVAGGMSQTNVAHDGTLTGKGSVAEPLGVNVPNVSQSILAGNVAPAFDPTRTSENPYKAGESVAYEGKTYTFKVEHYGTWIADDVFDGKLHDGNNFVYNFVGTGIIPKRTGLVAVDSNCLYEFELSDTEWPVSSLTTPSHYKFSVTGIKKDGTSTDLVVYYRDSQIVSSLFNIFVPSDVVAVYLFFRGDVGCKVTASMRLKYSYAVRGVVATMSSGSYGTEFSQIGIITHNVIPTNGCKYVRLKIDTPLGENETYVFSYSFFTVDSGVIPLDAQDAVPTDKRLGNHEVLGNTTGELEVEIPQEAVGFGFGLFKQVNGVSVHDIQDQYYKGSVSYYFYEIPDKLKKLINQTESSSLIELESGTFSDATPTRKIGSTIRVRNTNLVSITKYFKLPLISGFIYWIFCFDENLNELGTVGWVKRADVKDLLPGTKFVNFAIKDNLQGGRNISGDLSYLQNLINNDDAFDISRFVSFEQKYNPVSHYNSSGWKSRFNLIHTTDNHIAPNMKWSIVNLQETISLANYISSNIDAVVDTGDVTNGCGITSSELESEFTAAKDVFTKSQIPVLVTLGNHDGNDNSDTSQNLTPQQQWEWLYSALESRFSNIHFGDKTNHKAYCYLDLTRDSKGMRIIMLDQLDSPSYTTKVAQHTAIYSQSQIDWLVSLLENTPANYGVIICNHFPFAPYRASGYSEEWPCLNDGSFAQGWQMIPEIIQAFSSRSTLSRTYVDANGYQDIEVDADFSSVPTSSQFCFYMCGHTHSKNTFYVKQEGGVDYNQLMLVEDSSCLLGTALNQVWRDISSPVSNVFSVLSIDLTEKCVYRTSFGAVQKFNEVTAQRVSKIPFTENN